MKTIAAAIDLMVKKYAPMIQALDQTEFERKPSLARWSKKEILGHLVDSAQNNIQRFVRGQYEVIPKLVYSQDDWVRLQDYQSYDQQELIQLWVLLNRHLAHVLAAMDHSKYEMMCDTGKIGIEPHSLKFIADDYVAHLAHHLKQIVSP